MQLLNILSDKEKCPRFSHLTIDLQGLNELLPEQEFQTSLATLKALPVTSLRLLTSTYKIHHDFLNVATWSGCLHNLQATGIVMGTGRVRGPFGHQMVNLRRISLEEDLSNGFFEDFRAPALEWLSFDCFYDIDCAAGIEVWPSPQGRKPKHWLIATGPHFAPANILHSLLVRRDPPSGPNAYRELSTAPTVVPPLECLRGADL